MDRSAALIQRVAMGGTMRQMARVASAGIAWPAGGGRWMGNLRNACARVALDRLGPGCVPDLVRCNLMDKGFDKPLQWDGFDPLCALLMQPVAPERVMLALGTTRLDHGRKTRERLGEVGVRVVQAACRLVPGYGEQAREGEIAWLGVIDRLIAMGMGRGARLAYAPVGLLGACSNGFIARALLERGFRGDGSDGCVPALCLCQDPQVAGLLLESGASGLVPAMNFIDAPADRAGYMEMEDDRILARWCQIDGAIARQVLAGCAIKDAGGLEIERAARAICDNTGDERLAGALFRDICLLAGLERVEQAMGPEGAPLRRAVMGNAGMVGGYMAARAHASSQDLAAGTANDGCVAGVALARL